MSALSRLPRLFWIGLAILVVGGAPLLVFIAADSIGLVSDPNPNPVGLGLLFFASFWVGAIVMAVGVVRAMIARRGG